MKQSIEPYFKAVKALGFDEEPKYKELKDLFQDELSTLVDPEAEIRLDWEEAGGDNYLSMKLQREQDDISIKADEEEVVLKNSMQKVQAQQDPKFISGKLNNMNSKGFLLLEVPKIGTKLNIEVVKFCIIMLEFP